LNGDEYFELEEVVVKRENRLSFSMEKKETAIRVIIVEDSKGGGGASAS